MGKLRAFFCRHATFAALIIMVAVGVRALLPTGYMASASSSGMTIELCSGSAGQTIAIALPGSLESDHGDRGKSRADAPCAFSGIGGGALTAADPFVLAILVAFIMAAGLRPRTMFLPRWHGHLRPPLRGPPAIA